MAFERLNVFKTLDDGGRVVVDRQTAIRHTVESCWARAYSKGKGWFTTTTAIKP